MKMNRLPSSRRVLIAPFLVLLLAAGGAAAVPFTNCGPFTDVGPLICPFVLELYYSGITAGTSSTTYSPNDPVTRGQMAVFTSTALDLSLARSSRRAALGQWWTMPTPHYDAGLGLTTVGIYPTLLLSDGVDVWVANEGSNSISRVRASDGAVIGTWTGATNAFGIAIAMGRVFVTGNTSPGSLFMIDPTQAPGPVTTVSNALGNGSAGIAFDGSSLWTANDQGSVSRVTPAGSGTWTVTTFTTGFSQPVGAIFAAGSIWITDSTQNTLIKLNSDGSISQSVAVGIMPEQPTFDGKNIWVPNLGNTSLYVVRALDGNVMKILTGADGLSNPIQAAFDGIYVGVTNYNGSNGIITLFKAADFSTVEGVATPGMVVPYGITSDGVNFWISDFGSNTIGRF